MANPDLAPNALAKPAPHRRLKAATARQQSKADKLVYAAVDARDSHRCRVCHDYKGYEIQRHHVLFRSQGGETVTPNVISLCGNCHLVGIHGGHLRLSGNADTRSATGALCGVKVERLVDGVWRSEGWR